MKLKDMISLGLLGVVLVVMGSFLIGKLGVGSKQRVVEVEVVAPIDPNFNAEASSILLGQEPAEPANAFAGPADLSNGLGNSNPFGP